MKMINSKFEDFKNYIVNQSERSLWTYPVLLIVILDLAFIMIAGFWGLMVFFMSRDPLSGTLIFSVGIVYIYLFIHIMKAIHSLFDAAKYYGVNPSKLLIMEYPKIPINFILIMIVSYIEVYLILGSTSPPAVMYIFFVNIFIISLLIQMTIGSKTASLINVVVGLLSFVYVIAMIMIAFTHITS